jgi:DNA-binding transcriptional regulator YdaS (Cro superfamily)
MMNRPPLKTPNHPLYAAMAAMNPPLSANRLAGMLGVKHQQFSCWCNGQQWVPLAAVRQIEQLTGGRVKLGHWAKVRDRQTDQFWEHGARSGGPWAHLKGPQRKPPEVLSQCG